jgi:hypothetical protein
MPIQKLSSVLPGYLTRTEWVLTARRAHGKVHECVGSARPEVS